MNFGENLDYSGGGDTKKVKFVVPFYVILGVLSMNWTLRSLNKYQIKIKREIKISKTQLWRYYAMKSDDWDMSFCFGISYFIMAGKLGHDVVQNL